MRIALATLSFPADAHEALGQVIDAVRKASANGAAVICTPENYIPGLRGVGFGVDPVDPMFLDLAQVVLTRVARETSMTIIAGMERVGPSGLLASALVVGPRGILGWQDKVQTDPSEDGIYIAGTGRRLFEVAGVKFGVCLCHEGWRYPETVRWAARRGAQIVFHPQYSPAVHGSAPRLFCEPDGTFHSKAAICRAVENGIFFATVNYAVDESCTTSAVISPTGEVLCNQPYGEPGLLFADIEPAAATAVLARRLRAEEYA